MLSIELRIINSHIFIIIMYVLLNNEKPANSVEDDLDLQTSGLKFEPSLYLNSVCRLSLVLKKKTLKN